MKNTVKRDDQHGSDVEDASHFERPTKIIKMKRKRVLEVVDKNPRLTFQRDHQHY